MRAIVLRKFATLMTTTLIFAVGAFAQEKPKVAVYVTDGGDKSLPAKLLAGAGAHGVVGEALVKAINLTGKGNAVNLTKDITKEFGVSAGEAQAAAIGQQFGVQNLCVVTISGIRGKAFNLGVKMIDVQAGRVTATGGPAPVDLSNPPGILQAMTNIAVGLVSGLAVNAVAKAIAGPQAQPVQQSASTDQQAQQPSLTQAAQNQPVRRVAAAVYMSGEEPKGAAGAHMVIGEELAKVMSVVGGNRVVDRTDDIRKLLAEEQGDTLYRLEDETRVKAIGDHLGVKYLCMVEIKEVSGNSYYLKARIVNTTTAETVNTATAASGLSNSNEMANVAREIANGLGGGITSTVMEQQTEKSISEQSVYETEGTPQERPNGQSRESENWMSIEIGGALTHTSWKVRYRSGYGDSDSDSESEWGMGQYLHIDVTYAEYSNDIHGSRVLAKYPFGSDMVKMFPLLGVNFLTDVGSLFTFGGRVDIGLGEIAYLRTEFMYGVWKDRQATSFNVSSGLNIGLSDSKQVYLHPELLYSWTGTNSELNDNYRREISWHWLEFRIGIGYEF